MSAELAPWEAAHEDASSPAKMKFEMKACIDQAKLSLGIRHLGSFSTHNYFLYGASTHVQD